MLDYKYIDDDLSLGFVNEDFMKLLNTNKKECNDIGLKVVVKSQRIVIFGVTSSGKSTFINALIFQSDILPTGSASTTKCFVEIEQSQNDTNYLMVNNKQENISNLKKILTKEKNKELHVNLFYNFPEDEYFESNIIIDTPGTDFNEEYDENILQYCKEADVVILVASALNNVGKSMKQFCEKFKRDLSKYINLYVVLNYCDVLQKRDDWEKGIEENITTLTDIFKTANRAKMAFISASERMDVIKTDKNILDNEKSRIRNDSFLNLRNQLKNERGQISMVRRYGYLLDILEIMNKNQLCLSQIMNEQSVFFDVNLKILNNLPVFRNKINKIVLSYCRTIREEVHKIYINEKTKKVTTDSEKVHLIINENPDNCVNNNSTQSRKQIIQRLLMKIENDIKQKVMKEIIDYIERNNGNDKNKLIFVMNNVYFPKIMDKIHLVDSENVLEFKSGKIKMAIGAAAGAVALGAVLISIPFWPVMLPLELGAGIVAAFGVGGIGLGGGLGAVVGKIMKSPIARLSINVFMKKFAKDLINSFSNFTRKTKKLANISKDKKQIKKRIDNLEIKMVLFQLTGDTKMQNPIDKEFSKLYNESKEIIDQINRLILLYKHIDDDLNLEFVNEDFFKLLKENMKYCKILGIKLMNKSKKIVFFGESNSGKSSFINALIFQSNILPTDCESKNKCFVEIKRSIDNTTYLIVDDQKEDISTLKDIVTTEENQERNICLFHKFAEDNKFGNSIIIDTPGIVCDDYYTDKMLKYFIEADDVILVINGSFHIGETVKKFCDKYKNNLKSNPYVVFTFCDIIQSKDDWHKLKNENTKTLTEIFPTINPEKMAFISSLERMEIIKRSKNPFKNKPLKIRNDSFQKFSEQIKSKNDEMSLHYRHKYLLKILEIINEKQSSFSQVIKEHFPFPNVNFNILSGLPSFEKDIEKIVKSSYERFLITACKIYPGEIHIENNIENIAIVETGNQDNLGNETVIQSQEDIIKTLINETENEIKQKIKEEIINYIEINNGDDQDQLKFIMNNFYFPKIIDAKQFVYCGDILKDVKEIRNKITTAIEDAIGETVFCFVLAMTPVWSILIPFELVTSILTGIGVDSEIGEFGSRDGEKSVGVKIDYVVLEQIVIVKSLIKFGDDLIHSFSNFKTKRIKNSEFEETEQHIKKQIDAFTMKVNSFQEMYLK